MAGVKLVIGLIAKSQAQDDTVKFRRRIESVTGVMRLDTLRAREHGHYLIIDVKIGVDPHITVEEGHCIGKQVKQELMGNFSQVRDVFVLINPFDPDQGKRT